MKVAIVTGGTPNLAGPAGVTYLSLMHMSPKLFSHADKYFFSTKSLTECNAKALEKIGVSALEFDVGVGLASGASRYLKYFSEGILAKFETFRLSEHYDYVLWLDCDQVCVRELFDVVVGDGQSFKITDGGEQSTGWSNYVESPSFLKAWLVDNQHVSFDKRGICGNFFCVPAGSHILYCQARELFNKMSSELYGGEQGILYILMQDGLSKSTLLPHDLFTPHPSEWPIDRLLNTNYSARPYFLHAWSQPKFWNGLDDSVWNHFYREWVSSGGEEFFSTASRDVGMRRTIKYFTSRLSKLMNK